MIIEKSLINRLKELGLNSYEIKIWTALLSRGSATASELSDIANVPRSRSYDVLESLEKKGLVIPQFSKPIRYIAVDPIEGIERIKKRILEETNENINILEKVKNSEVLGFLKELYDQNINLVDPLEMSGAIKGRKNIIDHIRYLIKNSNNEINIITTSKAFAHKVENLYEDLENAAKKGVSIRIAAPVTDEVKEHVKKVKKIAEFKDPKHIRSRFGLFDDEHALLFLTNENVNHAFDSAVWIKSKDLNQSLKHGFEHIWNNL
ncbi:MAG: HTH-type transcriptional regulator, sugar sensing transcriptional regulator [Candidatus Woesearchaeota archaeon]|nr:HTH-type transcriptional regulator, sugar sensing transcriptional regulator [Candidatus Woesearchaeota archaeon]MDN5327843.1 HTH-type transcriptional regulator, sugar sensing transcriptional regulator [Candidatus Woesearchaeota archaeon]